VTLDGRCLRLDELGMSARVLARELGSRRVLGGHHARTRDVALAAMAVLGRLGSRGREQGRERTPIGPFELVVS